MRSPERLYRIGTSGWVYPHWKGRFYPEKLPQKDWFRYYSRNFNTVEINNTFYRMPGEAAFLRWRDQAPPGFVYAVKASRFLSHVKRLNEPEEALQRLMDNAFLLKEHLGPLLVQFPESFHRTALNMARLAYFLDLYPPAPPLVLEFRHATWFQEEVYHLMQMKKAALCVVSDPGRPTDFRVTGDILYVRFHGPKDARYAGDYPAAELESWAERIRSLAAGRDAYIYFNNDWEAHAVKNARQLRALLGAGAGPDR